MDKQLQAVKGGCLCGNVTFVVSGKVEAFHLCHCSRCRQATGSAHASNLFTQPENIKWLSGEPFIKRYQLPEAKSFSRQFCIECGSGLPYVNRAGTYLVIPAGSLVDPIEVIPDDQIYWDSRACWYDLGIQSQKFAEYTD